MVKTQDYLRDVVIILFAQKRIILFTFLLIALATILIAFFWPPTYEVEGSILIKGKKLEKSPEALEDAEIKMIEISEKDLISEERIITSHDVVRETIKRLKEKGLAYTDTPLEGEAFKQAVDCLQHKLSTRVVEDSNIIIITLKGADPKRMLIVLTEVMDSYIRQRSQIFNPDQAVSFYQRQADKFDADLVNYEQQLIDLAEKYQSPDPGKEIENNLYLKRDLERELDRVRNLWIEKQLAVKHLNQALAGKQVQFFSSIQVPSIANLGEKLQELYVERGTIRRVYRADTDKVLAIDRQINDTYAKLKGEVAGYARMLNNEAQIVHDQLTSLENRIRELSMTNIRLHAYQVEKRRIDRQIELFNTSYETFAKRLEEARINTSTDAGTLFSIRIMSKPFFDGETLFPNKRTFLPVGVIVGLLTACSLGFLAEYFDHTFKRPEDSQKYAGIPNLFSITRWDHGATSRKRNHGSRSVQMM